MTALAGVCNGPFESKKKSVTPCWRMILTPATKLYHERRIDTRANKEVRNGGRWMVVMTSYKRTKEQIISKALYYQHEMILTKGPESAASRTSAFLPLNRSKILVRSVAAVDLITSKLIDALERFAAAVLIYIRQR